MLLDDHVLVPASLTGVTAVTLPLPLRGETRAQQKAQCGRPRLLRSEPWACGGAAEATGAFSCAHGSKSWEMFPGPRAARAVTGLMVQSWGLPSPQELGAPCLQAPRTSLPMGPQTKPEGVPSPTTAVHPRPCTCQHRGRAPQSPLTVTLWCPPLPRTSSSTPAHFHHQEVGLQPP